MTTAAAITTPIGPLAVVLDEDGTVLASGFGGLTALTTRLGIPDGLPLTPPSVLAPLTDTVNHYFAGDIEALDDVPVRQSGGLFAQETWVQLREVPPGATVTYAQLADRAGSPGSARAAGQACARNLVAPFVPCHRVVPSGGGVGGYAYGADVKTWLLDHERAARDVP